MTFTKNELTSQLHILNMDHFIIMLNLALRFGRNDQAQGESDSGIVSYHDEKKCIEEVRFHNNQKMCVLMVDW